MEPEFCSVRTTSSAFFFQTKPDCTLRAGQPTAGSRNVKTSLNPSVVNQISLGAVKPPDLQVAGQYVSKIGTDADKDVGLSFLFTPFSFFCCSGNAMETKVN
ncbi:hypothetical protein AVEN_102096-1 [Araneus ventricosus]|uniref:Uncharacterized protein n=1 Tax=Araneus ventricosus TaxID=182803 RepID=A0A4Y2LNC4_ARAVE|nr:hypothetical protein AVEN_102096-1 [Araneus ventricosus]